ncbi:retropepsin-like domain-containing protein [Candidatus Woesearchaeota archaeon]|nr:retropepsin-like domain-containing protein [Candidatus Woesearchaeota archaeon]
MEIEFAFREEKSNVFGIIFRPVVDIVYISNGKEVEGTAYIDSGADISLIPRALGEDLGLKIEKGDSISEMSGIGKPGVPIVIKTIKLRLGDKTFNTRIAWALVEEVPLLLGRIDIFNIFDITFKRNEKTLFSERGNITKEAA